MGANVWLSANTRRINTIRTFLVQETFQDSAVQREMKAILTLVDGFINEIVRLQKEVDELKSKTR
jgi:hypothetical protein